MNQLVADRVLAGDRALRQPAVVFVQDYQMYCVPGLIRERRGPDVRIQHFVHIPWPTPQYWTVLPRHIRDAIVHGLLGADIIGFQTSRDVRNFLMTCEQNLDLTVDHRERTVFSEGRAVWAAQLPDQRRPENIHSALGTGPRCSRRSNVSSDGGQAPHPARRSDGLEQEHRARFPRVRAPARRASRADRRRHVLGIPAAEPAGHRRLSRYLGQRAAASRRASIGIQSRCGRRFASRSRTTWSARLRGIASSTCSSSTRSTTASDTSWPRKTRSSTSATASWCSAKRGLARGAG